MAKRVDGAVSAQQIQYLVGRVPYWQTPQVKFAIWARRWLFAYHQGRIKDNTYQGTYQEPVELHLIPYFGDRILDDILPIEITEFFISGVDAHQDHRHHQRRPGRQHHPGSPLWWESHRAGAGAQAGPYPFLGDVKWRSFRL